MRDSRMTERLTMHWVPVLDERGRTHLEARWTADPARQAPAHASHAA
jgi:hypothetical protein